MPYENVPFKSYCWSIGTTSFRTEQHNLSIETQLQLLNKFWNIESNRNKSWQDSQESYYYFLKDNNFLSGEASRPAKDAREKTSGLVGIGLINAERKLTEAGNALLQIIEAKNFSKNNELKISNDSYIYTKQLLKLSNNVRNNKIVRPYLILIYILSKLEYLTNEEFTYLLPICIDLETTNTIIQKIHEYRENQTTIDNILLNIILSRPNYPQAKQLFLDNKVDEELICTIGMNRKSKQYDKSYFPFYQILKKVCVDKNYLKLCQVYEVTNDLKLKTYWRKYLFNSTHRNLLRNNPEECISEANIFNVNNEQEFKEIFFNQLHLFKIQANLSDYSDLNRRYFKTTDTVIFSDNKVVFDIIPKYFYKEIHNNLFDKAFESCDLLENNCDIEEISNYLTFNKDTIYQNIQTDLGITIEDEEDIQNFINDERLNRFNTLIDEKFDNTTLIDLLDCFENRDDKRIYSLVTDNATIPTIFEYILGIIWYKVSEKQGNILDFMKLSLEADLLPKSHAGGGESDIVYEYRESFSYPQHTMLIEATLADEQAQRRMEMEPVSRHLGNHILETDNHDSYCTFISPYLDINVLNHFRGLKNNGYYNPRNHSQFVPNLKIIPLKTTELKSILLKNIKYSALYEHFKQAYNSNEPAHNWYQNNIKNIINL
ncbi:MAG: AlwI family type II restriction endonuclease [bacterium]